MGTGSLRKPGEQVPRCQGETAGVPSGVCGFGDCSGSLVLDRAKSQGSNGGAVVWEPTLDCSKGNRSPKQAAQALNRIPNPPKWSRKTKQKTAWWFQTVQDQAQVGSKASMRTLSPKRRLALRVVRNAALAAISAASEETEGEEGVAFCLGTSFLTCRSCVWLSFNGFRNKNPVVSCFLLADFERL